MPEQLLTTDGSALADLSANIPQKLYFRIGEVSNIVGVEAYVLRYWESEFPSVAPKRSGKGQRLYRRKDVESLLIIKHLLYQKKFTIEGARQSLKVKSPKRSPTASQGQLFNGDLLPEIRRELHDILGLLS